MKAFFGLADAGEAQLAAEDNHGFKQRRRVFASADGDTDWLEHLPGLQTQLIGCGAKCMVQRIVIEGDGGQNFEGVRKDATGQRGIALLG